MHFSLADEQCYCARVKVVTHTRLTVHDRTPFHYRMVYTLCGTEWSIPSVVQWNGTEWHNRGVREHV